ncbi:MAG: phospholipid carrier-dependent glycosyltransferase [Nitrospiraceae bacterium]|nr:phospholipid carrier-dependent glycosyltransferase [Nitrospiraceae bacterium]
MIEKLENLELKYYYLFVFLLSAIFFLARIYEPSLIWDDAKYALIAKNMLKTGNFLIPNVGFEYYFKKPPFFFWVISLFFKIFGTSEFSARLPSAIFGIIDALLIFYFGWKISKSKLFALISSLVFILNFEVIRVTTTVKFDSFILFVNLITIILLYNPSAFRVFLASLVISAGIMTKGPMAIIGLISILAYSLIKRNLKNTAIYVLTLFVSLVPFLLYVAYTFNHYPDFLREFLREFFENQIIGRINGSLKDGTPRSFLFYERSILKHFWPWNLALFYLIGLSIKRDWMKLKEIFQFKNNGFFQILLIMFLIVFISLHFISLKFTRYSYYLYPFLSLIVASVVVRLNLTKYVLIFSLITTFIYNYIAISCPCKFHKDKLKDLRPLVEIGLRNYGTLGIDRKIKLDYIYSLLFYFDNLKVGKSKFLITNNCSRRVLIRYKNFCIVRTGN